MEGATDWPRSSQAHPPLQRITGSEEMQGKGEDASSRESKEAEEAGGRRGLLHGKTAHGAEDQVTGGGWDGVTGTQEPGEGDKGGRWLGLGAVSCGRRLSTPPVYRMQIASVTEALWGGRAESH